MPIRTNRGRAAVYRRLWGWPLRSPGHLIATVIGFAVLVTAMSVFVPNARGLKSSATQSTAAPVTSGSSNQVGELPPGGARTSLPTKLPEPTAAPSAVAADPKAQAAALLWAQAWVDHPGGVTNGKWLEGLKPYTTDEYLPQLRSVDPANVPATKVTGNPEVIRSFTDRSEVDVQTNGPKLSLTLVKGSDGKWRVNKYTGTG